MEYPLGNYHLYLLVRKPIYIAFVVLPILGFFDIKHSLIEK
jgi:hypothetical protein